MLRRHIIPPAIGEQQQQLQQQPQQARTGESSRFSAQYQFTRRRSESRGSGEGVPAHEVAAPVAPRAAAAVEAAATAGSVPPTLQPTGTLLGNPLTRLTE